MTIQQWVYRNSRLPISITAIGICTVSIVYLCLWHSNFRKKQDKSVSRLIDVASMAIIQKNRPLLESVMQHAFYELSAVQVMFNSYGRTEIAYPQKTQDSLEFTSPPFSRKISVAIVGMPEYKFIFIVPLFQGWSLLRTVVLLLSIFGIGIWLTLKDLNSKLFADLIGPLSEGLTSETKFSINELEGIRLRNIEINDVKKQAAVANAIIEHNASVAHDIRDPISAIDKLIAAASIPEDVRPHLGHAIARMRQITDELLEKGKASYLVKYRTDVQDVREMIMPLVAEKQKQFGERTKIQITLKDHLTTPAAVKIHPSDFKRALSNLINNGVEAIRESGSVSIEIREMSNHVRIEICDTGSGVPEDYIGMIGTPGFTYGKSRGSGLGISGAKEIIERAGGNFGFVSKWGKGSVASILLPVT